MEASDSEDHDTDDADYEHRLAANRSRIEELKMRRESRKHGHSTALARSRSRSRSRAGSSSSNSDAATKLGQSQSPGSPVFEVATTSSPSLWLKQPSHDISSPLPPPSPLPLPPPTTLTLSTSAPHSLNREKSASVSVGALESTAVVPSIISPAPLVRTLTPTADINTMDGGDETRGISFRKKKKKVSSSSTTAMNTKMGLDLGGDDEEKDGGKSSAFIFPIKETATIVKDTTIFSSNHDSSSSRIEVTAAVNDTTSVSVNQDSKDITKIEHVTKNNSNSDSYNDDYSQDAFDSIEDEEKVTASVTELSEATGLVDCISGKEDNDDDEKEEDSTDMIEENIAVADSGTEKFKASEPFDTSLSDSPPRSSSVGANSIAMDGNEDDEKGGSDIDKLEDAYLLAQADKMVQNAVDMSFLADDNDVDAAASVSMIRSDNGDIGNAAMPATANFADLTLDLSTFKINAATEDTTSILFSSAPHPESNVNLESSVLESLAFKTLALLAAETADEETDKPSLSYGLAQGEEDDGTNRLHGASSVGGESGKLHLDSKYWADSTSTIQAALSPQPLTGSNSAAVYVDPIAVNAIGEIESVEADIQPLSLNSSHGISVANDTTLISDNTGISSSATTTAVAATASLDSKPTLAFASSTLYKSFSDYLVEIEQQDSQPQSSSHHSAVSTPTATQSKISLTQSTTLAKKMGNNSSIPRASLSSSLTKNRPLSALLSQSLNTASLPRPATSAATRKKVLQRANLRMEKAAAPFTVSSSTLIDGVSSVGSAGTADSHREEDRTKERAYDKKTGFFGGGGSGRSAAGRKSPGSPPPKRSVAATSNSISTSTVSSIVGSGSGSNSPNRRMIGLYPGDNVSSKSPSRSPPKPLMNGPSSTAFSLTEAKQEQVVGVADSESSARANRLLQAEVDDLKVALAAVRGEMGPLRDALLKAEEDKARLREDVGLLERMRVAVQEELEDVVRRGGARSGGVVGDLASKEEVASVRKEIAEQEVLIKGYQTENERLLGDNKTLRAQLKELEHKSRLRVESLQRDISTLKTQLSQPSSSSSSVPVLDVARLAARVDELESALETSARDHSDRETNLFGENAKLKAQLADARSTIDGFRGLEKEEVDAMKAQWEEEKRKLQGALVEVEGKLEREIAMADAERARERAVVDARVAEVLGLSSTLSVPRSNNAAQKSRGVAITGTEGKRIKELEKLVVELQDRLTRKEVKKNSASIGVKPVMDEATYIRHLKDRIAYLEAEIESKEGLWETRLNSLQQEFSNMKAQYEKRISELMTRDAELTASTAELVAKVADQKSSAASDRVSELELQLEQLFRAYHDKLIRASEMEREEMSSAAEAAARQTSRAREAALRSRIVELENLVDSQAKTMEEMRADRAAMEQENVARMQVRDAMVQSYEEKLVALKKEFHDRIFGDEEQKLLEDIHRSRVENENLRGIIADLNNRLEISEGTRKAVHENTIAILRQAQEESAKIALAHHERGLAMLREETRANATLSVDHELQNLKYALARCEAELTQWKSKASLLEKEKQDWISAADLAQALQDAKRRLRELETSIEQLTHERDDLSQRLSTATSSWPPDRKRFENMVSLIDEMESRSKRREVELQDLIEATRRNGAEEVERVKNHYKPLLAKRESEVRRFRSEVDGLVLSLDQLRRFVVM